MRLGIDLDNVTVDFDGGWRRIWNDLNPDRKVPQQSKGWLSPFHDTDLTPERFWEWTDEHDVWGQLPAVFEAVEHLEKLEAEGHTLIFITHRHRRAWRVTVDWLDRHGLLHHELAFVRDKTWVDADLYADDDPKVLEAVWDKGLYGVKFSRPWNRDAPCQQEVVSWREFHRLVEMWMP